MTIRLIQSNTCSFWEKEGTRVEIITKTGVGSETEIGQIAETDLGNCHTEVGLSIEKKSWEEVLEEVTEEILGTISGLTEVEVGKERGNFQGASGGMAETIVCQDEVQGQVQIETGSGVSGTEKMITLLRTIQTWKQKHSGQPAQM